MFDYKLPPHLIAQHPCEKRDHSRLLVLQRFDDSLSHHQFADLPELLNPGDLLILNDTRVLPARLLGHREKTGGKWEGLFLRELPNGNWNILCQTRGKLQSGERITIDPGPLTLQLIQKNDMSDWEVEPSETGSPLGILQRCGHTPLPPYIRKGIGAGDDIASYQTVYAKTPGAVAAPTAGLHFTEQLFEKLNTKGICRDFVTLHVGWGTFQPLTGDDPNQHKMHYEWGSVSQSTVDNIAACRRRGGKVIAVGTTTVRALETAAIGGKLTAWSGETDLFIVPPYTFQVVDGLVTNFHLPKTTLLLLVSAFAGTGLLEKAYATAITEQYRFYSYGDAMLIL